MPARQDLGAVLVKAGRYAKAEQAFREDLNRFPRNGWSLYGLAVALSKQGKNTEAENVEADFKQVWATADVEPGIAVSM